MLKVYDLTITNVFFCGKFQQSQSNAFRLFQEHSKNICLKDIPRISLEYHNVIKMFLWSQKIRKIVLLVIL